jgi:hypothetical protein
MRRACPAIELSASNLLEKRARRRHDSLDRFPPALGTMSLARRPSFGFDASRRRFGRTIRKN